MSNDALRELREKLDGIDRQITSLLEKRFKIAAEVGKVKKDHGLTITDTAREDALIKKLEETVEDPLLKEYIRPIYSSIITACKAPQKFVTGGNLPFRKVGIIGMGVIGGSLAKALHMKDETIELYSLKREDSERRDTVAKDVDLQTLAQTCDLIVIASPIDTVLPIAQSLSEHSKGRSSRLIVIDVASVKSFIADEFEKLTTDTAEFLATHPMAGSDKSGYDAAKASLFLHNPWIITPHSGNKSKTVEAVRELIATMGSRPVTLDAAEHDQAVAVVSHLVFLVSTYLFAFIATDHEEILGLAGSGFESTTRLASANAQMHDQIFRHNMTPILEALQDFLRFINSHRIDSTDSADFFSAYKTSRDEYISKKYSE